ncbi:DNA phosphorothioation-associated putative methyltransferase [Methylorubrum extorquens]
MRYGRLTADLERLGLLTGTAAIGTRLGWERRLREAGVVVIGHEVRDDSESEPPIEIKRHLAALRRAGLSTPIQALLRYGVIDAGATIFDYGCGRGSDVEGLRAAGVHASGWDRYFAPEAQKQGADVVNLGFVLNVIERPKERIEVLRDAFALARRCLAVAVITSSRARLDSCRPYGDGYVTRWGTFQKFYLPGELKAFVEDTLGRAAVPAGPGLFFVFRDSLAEQWFLATRQARSAPSPVTMLARRHLASDSRAEELRSELESIVARAYELGRIPVPDEVPQDVKPRLAKAKIGLAAALRLGAQLCDPEQLANARKSRVDGLRVYFALNLFNGRVAYKKLPERLQRVGRDGSHGGSADRQLRQSGDRRYHRH